MTTADHNKAQCGVLPTRRVGLFGGSFNPPHRAHWALAHEALQALALDELRWVPAGKPWQKPTALCAPEHRLAMLRLMLTGEPRFVLDEQEMQRSGPSYTVDTVLATQAAVPNADVWVVIGQDQLARLPTWHRWQELAGLVTLAVAARGGDAIQAPPELLAVPHRLARLNLPAMAISSTAVRAACAAGQNIENWVPQAVARYIEQHRLYRA